MNVKNIVNIAAYKFVKVQDLNRLRAHLLEEALRQQIKGTIILGDEGINLILAGTRKGVDGWIEFLRSDQRFSDMEFKESYSENIPFGKMVVKIKPEIVTMGVASIEPGKKRGSHITANQFKQWLDEDREMTVLDTRNRFEVEIGTFDNAIDLNIKNFRDFPEAVKHLDQELKKKPLVMFCIGGIRCEKASLLLEDYGFEQIYQLEGGILTYFEEVGGEHYHGDCFVFDERITLDPNLEQTGEIN